MRPPGTTSLVVEVVRSSLGIAAIDMAPIRRT